jgi:hypothetical protein
VRKLYLPFGGHRFRSRRAYRLAYASQREAVHDRAMRRARKLRRRLGDDPMDGHYPEKPLRMRWAMYDRLLDKLIAANRIPDERMLLLASKLGAGRPPDRNSASALMQRADPDSASISVPRQLPGYVAGEG